MRAIRLTGRTRSFTRGSALPIALLVQLLILSPFCLPALAQKDCGTQPYIACSSGLVCRDGTWVASGSLEKGTRCTTLPAGAGASGTCNGVKSNPLCVTNATSTSDGTQGSTSGSGSTSACTATLRSCTRFNCIPQDYASLQSYQTCVQKCLSCGRLQPGGGTTGGEVIGTVGNVVTSPLYVNLYWDAAWDADNPTEPKASLDAFTAAILASSFVTGLAEYGVTSASYGGGFTPAPTCPQKAPVTVSYWDPVNPSIMGFLNCELQTGGLPKGPGVIYNVILPAYSLESEAGGLATFCSNVPPVSWHFHDTPYSAEGTAALAAAGIGLSGFLPGFSEGNISFGSVVVTVTVSLGAVQALETLSQGPIYTIESANTSCTSAGAGFTSNLLHEMVEAATDPFPPVGTVFSGSGEIADLCDTTPGTSPFVPSAKVVPAILPGSLNGTPFTSLITVPSYWSFDKQQCITGVDTTAVGTPIVTMNSGNGATLSLIIAGSGFGVMPPAPFLVPGAGTLPYIALQDIAQNQAQQWQAGNSLNADLLNLNVASWSDKAITVNGIGQVGKDFTMTSADTVQLWICNPASGNCNAANVMLTPAATAPNLAVALSIAEPEQNAPYVVIYIDGKSIGSLGDGQATSWIPLKVGNHTVSAKTSNVGYTITYEEDCNANGQVNLIDGANRNCLVSVVNDNIVNNSGCQKGTHCCGAGNGKCLPRQCVSNKNPGCP